ncbi:CHAT domain-containing protein [Ornithinimicrobium sufpigmenti]|uniref:CHAT domain-containing protein n=1 Tax=Ornithinimicrobium sufpigmenti TaxID=2508882 RepID=UPI001036DC6E|nr:MULTISPECIES: CHAT domain-containing protein [unclassified Ornithinimicrobium]
MTVLGELYAAVQRGDGDAWLAAHPQHVNAETGRAAYDEARRALAQGDPRAGPWSLAAQAIFYLAGEHEAAIKASLLRFTVNYATAKTPEEYGQVRQALLRLADAADAVDCPSVAGEARIIAADCSFWTRAALPEAEAEVQKELARQLLEDTVAAWEGGAAHAEVAQVEQLTSLTIQVLDLWLGRVESMFAEDVQGLLARLVRAAHACVPHDVFDRPEEAMKRSVLARSLTDAAVRLDLGVPSSLADRLATALALAASEGQQEAWAVACRAILVDGARAFDRESLDRLRKAFYEVHDPRARFRSRLGRLMQAARLDELVGEDLAHLVRIDTPDVAQIFHLTETASARTLLDGLDGLLTTPDDELCTILERTATDFPPALTDDPVLVEMRLLSQLPVGSEDALAELEERSAQVGAGYAGVADPTDLRSVQRLLRPGEVMLRYVLPHRWSHPAYLPGVVVLTAADATYVRLPDLDAHQVTTARFTIDDRSPLDTSALGNAVLKTRLAMSSVPRPPGPLAKDYLTAMHELLLAPVRETGLADDCDHWVVVPQRSLHLVPWMALRDDAGRWLLDDAAVTVVPSGSVWSRLRQRREGQVRRLGVLADPLVGYAGLPQLPGAMKEMELLTAAWRGRGLTVEPFAQEDATFEALSRAAARCDVIQVAAHGSFPGDAALFDHQLLLSPELDHPGPVTADAIRRLDAANVGCVVLSVCDGGAYRVGRGDEPYGLVPALLEAGARSVIAAQWAVDDDRARALMSRTGELLAQHPPAQALRQACIELRESAPDGDWTHAAFVAISG